MKPSKTKKDNYIYCTIPFLHKAIENIGIRELFKNKDVKAYLPHRAHELKIRTTFSYGPTVGKKLFNYNKILTSINNVDISTSTCDCSQRYGSFVYPAHGHVHTGKLDIIENELLRDVMGKGAKFRLTPSVSKSKLWFTISEAITKCIQKMSRKCKMKAECFLVV